MRSYDETTEVSALAHVGLRPLELHVRPEGRDGYSVINGVGEQVAPPFPDRVAAESFIAGARYLANQLHWLLGAVEVELSGRLR